MNGLPHSTLKHLMSALLPGGRLFAPPVNFFQIGAGENVQIDAATDKVAWRFASPCSFGLEEFSYYLAANAAAGNLTWTIHEDGTAVEPNGDLNGSVTNAAPENMTSNSLPSPLVAGAVDVNGSATINAAGAYQCFDGGTGAYTDYLNVTIDNAAAVDKGGGEVGIPSTGHGLADGTIIYIAGTTNYDAVYTMGTSSADEIVITATYAAETFAGTEIVRYGPTAAKPINITLDLGEGNSLAPNKWGVENDSAAAMPRDIELWGSNLAAPDGETDGDWVSLDAQVDIVQTLGNQVSWHSFNNATAYRHFRWQVTDAHATANYQFTLENLFLVSAASVSAPGTQIASFGTQATGSGTGWKRISGLAPFICDVDKPRWLVCTGATGVDVSFLKERNMPGPGKCLDDSVKCVTSADTGTTYSECLVDGLPAEVCLVMGSTADHVAKLFYGRRTHAYVPFPDGALYVIPQKAISLDVSALTEDGEYYAYLYMDSGDNMTLEASLTGDEGYSGYRVKEDDTTRLLAGWFSPAENISTKMGVIDGKDARRVISLDPIDKIVGKGCPYSSATTLTMVVDGNWNEHAGTAGDFDFQILMKPGDVVNFLVDIESTQTASVSYALAKNGYIPDDSQQIKRRSATSGSVLSFVVESQKLELVTFRLMYRQQSGTASVATLFGTSATVGDQRMNVLGKMGV